MEENPRGGLLAETGRRDVGMSCTVSAPADEAPAVTQFIASKRAGEPQSFGDEKSAKNAGGTRL